MALSRDEFRELANKLYEKKLLSATARAKTSFALCHGEDFGQYLNAELKRAMKELAGDLIAERHGYTEAA